MRIDWLTEIDRQAGLLVDPVGGAVPGAGLVGGDRRVGDQLDAGAQDLGAVAVDDDRAVHLGQLAQPGGGELDVEHEAAGAQRLDGLVVAEDDQRAGVAAQDPLQAVAQRGAGGDRGQRRAQRVVDALGACHCTAPARRL